MTTIIMIVIVVVMILMLTEIISILLSNAAFQLMMRLLRPGQVFFFPV